MPPTAPVELIDAGTPATPTAAVELIDAGTPATPTEAVELVDGAGGLTSINGMRVSGSTSPTGANSDFTETGTMSGRPRYNGIWGYIEWTSVLWSIGNGTSRFESASPHGALPSDVEVWTPVNGSTGTLAVTRLQILPLAAAELIDGGTPATPDAPGSLV